MAFCSTIDGKAYLGEWVSEEFRGIEMSDLANLVDRYVAVVLLDVGLGIGPRRVGVGVVDFEQDVIDPDTVPAGEARGVVDGAEPEVSLEDLGGTNLFR